MNNITNGAETDTVEGAMLTTADNPYNPFTQFNEWYAFDIQKGYNSCGYLARIANVSDELSEKDYSIAVEKAIDEIVRLNILGIYRKVTRLSLKSANKSENGANS